MRKKNNVSKKRASRWKKEDVYTGHPSTSKNFGDDSKTVFYRNNRPWKKGKRYTEKAVVYYNPTRKK